MYEVRTKTETIKMFYTFREASQFSKAYSMKHKVLTQIVSGASAPTNTEQSNAPELDQLCQLLKRQRTKAGRKAVEDAIAIITN